MTYLIVVPVRIYRVSADTFATESAFVDHLRALRDKLPRFTRFVVAGVGMPKEQYEASRQHLGHVDERKERLSFVKLYEDTTPNRQLWLHERAKVLKTLQTLVQEATLVHSGVSHDVRRPVELAALMMATSLGKKTIAITDIDRRNDPKMLYRVGRWSLKNYLASVLVYDPLRSLQHHWIARSCDLVLFKGRKLVDDYGGEGRPHVREFLDPGFSREHVIPPAGLEKKRQTLADVSRPLELLYFGRFTFYKGVDRCIRALDVARRNGCDHVRLTLMGTGEEQPALEALVQSLGLQGQVTFRGPIRYGAAFFEVLRAYDLMMATPLSVDTPRSTWDAIASGLPLLAFDTEFYKDIGRRTGAVDTVPWPSVEALAKRIAHYAQHREELIAMATSGVNVARDNTQETWLQERVRWTEALFGDPASRPSERLHT